MSQLQTLETKKLRSVLGDFPGVTPGECAVLWSKPPQLIPDVPITLVSQQINASSRKLKTGWAIELPRERTYEVREEYTDLSDEELKQLQVERASFTMHIDGRVEVKRLSNQRPEDYINDPRLISRSITCHG